MRLHSIKRLALTVSLLAAFVPVHASVLSAHFNAVDSFDGVTNMGYGDVIYQFDASSQTAQVNNFHVLLNNGAGNFFNVDSSNVSNYMIGVDANGILTSFGAFGVIPNANWPLFSDDLVAYDGFNSALFYPPEGTISFTYDFAAPVVLVPDAPAPDANVPEPFSISLFGLGLAGLLGARRRKA